MAKKSRQKDKKTLDRPSEKPRRGRPGVRANEIAGRSETLRYQLDHQWALVTRKGLLIAQTPAEVNAAIEGTWLERELPPTVAPLVLQVLSDPQFPTRKKAQIGYLADSLAAQGRVSPRRSRDICTAERSRKKKQHRIIRQDFYIECTCGYEGPAENSSCPGCGTKVPHEIAWQFRLPR